MSHSNYTYPNILPNQMVPENIYGLQGEGCRTTGTCIPNTFDAMQSDPSLHEIASFNQNAPMSSQMEPDNQQESLMQATQAYELGGSTSGPSQQFNGNLQQIPEIERIESNDSSAQVMPLTPATTLPSGATLSDHVKRSLGIPQSGHSVAITPESLQFHNGFLRTQIGRRVTVDFLMGSNTIVTKSGYLLGVASDYIIINELDTNDITTCDYYNIKFMRFYY